MLATGCDALGGISDAAGSVFSRVFSKKLAIINGEAITSAELERYRDGADFGRGQIGERTAFSFYLDRRLFLQAARAREIDPGEPRRASGARVQLKRESLLIDAVRDRIVEEEVTDEAVRRYYDEHIDEFTDSRIHYRFVQVRPSHAEEITARLQTEGDLDAIAHDYSLSFETSRRCEDLTFSVQNTSSHAFHLALGRLERPGQIVGTPTLHSYGFVQRLETPPPTPDPFLLVEPDIRQRMECESAVFFVEMVRNSAQVEILDPDLESSETKRLRELRSAGRDDWVCQQKLKLGHAPECEAGGETELEIDEATPAEIAAQVEARAREKAEWECSDARSIGYPSICERLAYVQGDPDRLEEYVRGMKKRDAQHAARIAADRDRR